MKKERPAFYHYDRALKDEDARLRRHPNLMTIPLDQRNDISAMTDWLEQNINDGCWTWGWQTNGDKLDVSIGVFSFKRQEDAVLFFMTFGP